MLAMILIVAGRALCHAQMYRLWQNQSSQALLDQGRAYVAKSVKSDSAMVCFTIVSNRYYDAMNRKEKRLCVLAMNNLACSYTYGYIINFPQALSYLTKALKIADDNGFEREKGIIYINMANLYSLCGDNFEIGSMVDKANEYYLKGFQQGLKTNTLDLQTSAFIQLFTRFNVPNVPLQEFNSLFDRSMPGNTHDLTYARMLYKAVEAEKKSDYSMARRRYTELLPFIKLKWAPEISVMYTHMSIARTYVKEHSYGKAIEAYKQVQTMAKANGNLSMLSNVSRALSWVYQMMNDTTQAERYKMQHFALRDSLISSYRMNVTEGMFLEMAEQRTQQLVAEQRVRRAIIYMLLLLLAAVGAFVAILVWKNRQLALRNRKLYDNNVAMLHAEELMREQREQEQAPPAPGDPKSGGHRSAPLDTGNMQLLYDRIQKIMENPEWFCRNDFSLPMLAQLVDSNKTYVSQTINACYHENFVTLLGNCRVKEACRRINNYDQYGQFTLESISEGVGFKSRTTFTTAFKRLIGLTPSEYLKISRKQDKK